MPPGDQSPVSKRKDAEAPWGIDEQAYEDEENNSVTFFALKGRRIARAGRPAHPSPLQGEKREMSPCQRLKPLAVSPCPFRAKNVTDELFNVHQPASALRPAIYGRADLNDSFQLHKRWWHSVTISLTKRRT